MADFTHHPQKGRYDVATVASLLKGYGPDFPPLEELFGIEPSEADELRLSQPTPAMGRYLKQVKFLKNVTSQNAVGLTRFYVLIEQFIALSDLLTGYNGVRRNHKVVHSLTDGDKARLRSLAVTSADVLRAERLERVTDHDTAAAGDYLKLLIGTEMSHLEDRIEGVAFAMTSEDTMGSVFGIIGNQVVYGHFLPKLLHLMERILEFVDFVERDGPLVVPASTHQQGAEPTTFGKKMTTMLEAIDFHIGRLMENGQFIPFTGKFGGAVGNLTNHRAAYPDINWRSYARSFVESLGLTYQPMTYQSVTYAVEAHILTVLGNIISQVMKLVRDFINLASCPGQLFIKRQTPGVKASSAMPGKSNAWNMEGALQMLDEARTSLFHYAQALPNFMHEGDMGRSYLCRIGDEMVGDMVHRGYQPNPDGIQDYLDKYPGMAGSSLQTVLKVQGIEGDAYRQIQRISFTKKGTLANASQFAEGLEGVMQENDLDDAVREELRGLIVPANNTGFAHELSWQSQMDLTAQISKYQEQLERWAPAS